MTGLALPPILQGTSGVGGYSNTHVEKAQRQVAVWREGIALGLNALDSADTYGGGFSEELVGNAIRGIRDRVIVATKFNPPEQDLARRIRTALEKSLRRLRTDFIDLYQIHYPNPLVRIEDVLEPLALAVDEGKIRFVGLSNFSVTEATRAKQLCPKLVISNQVEFNLAVRPTEEDAIRRHQEYGLKLIAYSPLNQGRIVASRAHRNILERIALRHGRSLAQIVLRWVTSIRGVHAVTKASTVEHLHEISDSQDFVLSQPEIDEINKLPPLAIRMVDPKVVLLKIPSQKLVYATLQDAIANPLGLEPSPVQIAALIKARGFTRPVELRSMQNGTGGYQYKIDSYDVLGQVRRYWGWVVAYGADAPMPAYVLDDV